MKMVTALTCAAVTGFAPCVAIAADITVLSGGAVEPGLHAALSQFEKSTGHHVKITFNTALTTSGKASAAARELVAYLGTAEAKKALSANGVE